MFALNFAWGCILLQMAWSELEGGPTSASGWVTGIVFTVGGLFFTYEGLVGFVRKAGQARRDRQPHRIEPPTIGPRG